MEYLGSLSVLIGVIFYFSESGDRVKQRHYQAWQVINTAQGKGGSGGRIEAMQELNADKVPLVGVNASSAFLQGIHLERANLLRADLSAADLRGSALRQPTSPSPISSPPISEAAIFKMQISQTQTWPTPTWLAVISAGANLDNADLSSADLRNANLQEIAWQHIAADKVRQYRRREECSERLPGMGTEKRRCGSRRSRATDLVPLKLRSLPAFVLGCPQSRICCHAKGRHLLHVPDLLVALIPTQHVDGHHAFLRRALHCIRNQQAFPASGQTCSGE